MKQADLQRRLKELYLPPADHFVLVDVPDLRFVMIDGVGADDRSALDHAVKWLFGVIYPIKRIVRERMGSQFVEPPLEGLWWADDMEDFIRGRREKMRWRMMIVYEPDWLTGAMFEDAVASTRARLGEPPGELRLETYHEGLAAQILHVGPNSREPETLARLHHEFMPARRLLPNGYHHEIYLNDPRRVAPEKLRTVLRQPVKRSGQESEG